MTGCCAVVQAGTPPVCPMSGQATRPVGRKTLESLLEPLAKAELKDRPYYFCDAPDCDAVYVSALADHIITKDKLIIRGGIKEAADPVPLCYCFGYDRRAVREDIKAKGSTGIPGLITQRVKTGECRCEEANPSGGCCLRNVAKAVKQAEALKARGAP